MTRPAPDIAKDLRGVALYQQGQGFVDGPRLLREAADALEQQHEALKAERADSDFYWQVIKEIARTPVWTDDPEALTKAVTFQTLARNAHSGRPRARAVLGGDGQ